MATLVVSALLLATLVANGVQDTAYMSPCGKYAFDFTTGMLYVTQGNGKVVRSALEYDSRCPLVMKDFDVWSSTANGDIQAIIVRGGYGYYIRIVWKGELVTYHANVSAA